MRHPAEFDAKLCQIPPFSKSLQGLQRFDNKGKISQDGQVKYFTEKRDADDKESLYFRQTTRILPTLVPG